MPAGMLLCHKCEDCHNELPSVCADFFCSRGLCQSFPIIPATVSVYPAHKVVLAAAGGASHRAFSEGLHELNRVTNALASHSSASLTILSKQSRTRICDNTRNAVVLVPVLVEMVSADLSLNRNAPITFLSDHSKAVLQGRMARLCIYL